jgi:NAD(P)-dependent dehydrogenase (short-subunit alcohol dehydrogenase family)
MRFAIESVEPALAAAIAAELVHAGHEPGEGAQIAVIGVAAPTGEDLLDLGQSGWDETIGALRSTFLALRRAATTMIDGGDGGRIVVLVPVHAMRPARACGRAAVAGSFMTTVAQVAAVELAPAGIRVNVVAVGPVEGADPPSVVDGVPIGRLVRPEEVGKVCRLLACNGTDAVTGAVVPVDGGYAVTKAVGGSPYARTD